MIPLASDYTLLRKVRNSMGPFNIPWVTFLAFVVIDVSILIAIIWALVDIKREQQL